ncbi:T9SS type A sorting domain-containing protein [Flavobacterium paronense]|uniref:T9SS type A sorting domain-containing protein n=1 Tax=Flavobacterium paronense TaxID=1392775 RepID=A0ABV5GFI9_9FLAO|nr:T9SS type A sorting domain-containing protein [Flavobacterium paronense]MDN3678198.1 T9SS type A sorting domain-containing protein [Flavobacterium paronense]
MKKITILFSLVIFQLGFSQTLPLDFESATTLYPFTDFDGGVATKIPNPQISGINTSATVMQLVKSPGAVWAGSKITMAAPIDLTTDRVFKVKVLSPVAGKKLLLKFEGPGFFFEKLSAPITTANVWEELTFDFSSDAVNNLNNQIVFIFDIGTQGDGGPNSTYLFDDVTQSAGTGPILQLPVLPMDFESTTVSYPFIGFAGGDVTIIPNPDISGINTSAKVAKMIKSPGEVYGGAVIQMDGPIDFSSTTKIVKVKVWSPVAGKKLMLKFEGSPVDFDNGAFETEATITNANVWEELLFDYNSPTLFPPVNNNDNKIVFFFDFGTQGDGGPNSTYYFDDVAFSDGLSTPSFNILNVKTYPNPVANQMTIEANNQIQEVSIYNLLGQEVIKKSVKSNTTTLQTIGLQSGIYITKMKMSDGTESTSKFIKK